MGNLFANLQAESERQRQSISKQKSSKSQISKKKKDVSDTTTPRHRDTTVSRNHDTTSKNLNTVQTIRKAVKQLGKEAATHRFTVAEKSSVADIIHVYRGKGIRTTENEIARIGVNFLVKDFEDNGKNSILEKVLKALNE